MMHTHVDSGTQQALWTLLLLILTILIVGLFQVWLHRRRGR